RSHAYQDFCARYRDRLITERSGRCALLRGGKGSEWWPQAISLDWSVPPALWRAPPQWCPLSHWSCARSISMLSRSKLTAPDFERLARIPWPIASLASSGIRALSSVLAFSCSRWASLVRRNTFENSAHAFDELISTIRTASTRARGGSAPKRRGVSPLSTQRQNFFSAVRRRCWYSGSAEILISSHLAPPVMIESTAAVALVTHMLCWTCGIYLAAAASSENDHGNMNFASKTAPVCSTMPSRVATIQRITGCWTRCCTCVMTCPVLRSNQCRLSGSVTRPSWTMRLSERSFGSASPRFSRHRRNKAASSLPIITRASEPPMKLRRLRRLEEICAVSNGRVMTPSNSRARASPPQHCK